MMTGVQPPSDDEETPEAIARLKESIELAKELAAHPGTNLADVNATNLPASEGYGSISGAPSTYRRTTTLTTNPGGTTGIRVDVSVFYKPVTGRGVLATERSVALSIFLANR